MTQREDIISRHRVEAERNAIEVCLSHALEAAATMRADWTAVTIANALVTFAHRQRLDRDPAGLLSEIAELVGRSAARVAAGLLCPMCDGPTRPDPHRSGARYCDACDEVVLYNKPMATGVAAEIAGIIERAGGPQAADQIREAARVASWAAERLAQPLEAEEVNGG